MARKVTQDPTLHPEIIVYVFRHGHAAPSKEGARGDFGRVLSAEGIKQSRRLGLSLGAAEIRFDQVICSAAGRTKQTALNAGVHFEYNEWYDGKGWELYSPASEEDNAAMWRLTEEMEQRAKTGEISSAMSYAEFKKLDATGFFARFREETLQTVMAIPGIETAQRIAIFNHAVVGNAVAEALFPQHAAALETIELAPCDCIRLTTKTCQHIPLMT